MIKAMLVVASLGINTEMPNMKTCLEAREQLLKQDKKIQVLCVPSNPKPDRKSEMKEMFNSLNESSTSLQRLMGSMEKSPWRTFRKGVEE